MSETESLKRELEKSKALNNILEEKVQKLEQIIQDNHEAFDKVLSKLAAMGAQLC